MTNQFSDDKMNLTPVFFKLEILEKYFENPNYAVSFTGHSGWIESKTNDDYLSLFAFGYSCKDDNERVIATFEHELSQMPIEMQYYWKSYQLSNVEDYYLHRLFIEENIHAEFIDEIPIYTALLMEISCINKLYSAIGIPNMFNNEYSYDIGSRPDDYHVILLPTYKNYYNFVTILEKIVINNLNYKSFQVCADKVRKVERKDKDNNDKGSIQMLVEWLSINLHNTSCDIDKTINQPLRALRKERQVPAHGVKENKYDFQVWEKQQNLISDVYEAMRAIRLLLVNHPNCKNIEIPDSIFFGDNIYVP